MKKLFLLTVVVATLATGCTVPGYLQSILEVLIPVVATGFAGLITMGFAYLTSWLKAKAKSQNIDNAIIVMGEHIESIVISLVDEYKQATLAALEDGKIDEDEKRALKELAVQILKDRVNAKELKGLAGQMGLSVGSLTDMLISKLSGVVGARFDQEATNTAFNVSHAKRALSGEVPYGGIPVDTKKVTRRRTTKKTTTKKKATRKK